MEKYMKVMVIGGGGREHAIVKKLKESGEITKLSALPGNGGIAADAECVDIGAKDIENITKWAVENAIDFAVVAPDDPLVLGAVDALEAAGIACFGPNAKAAAIEGSKVFAKELMKKYGIPTAEYSVFDDMEKALEYVETTPVPVVVKADGLALGKGVIIAETKEAAKDAVRSMMEDKIFGESGSRIVIEEFLTGPEVSVLSFTDGKTIVPMVSSMDHKRAKDGDKGLNTGGMGAYSPVPLITDEDVEYSIENIMKPVAAGMVAEGRPFKGVLYGGLMKTSTGVKVIEFNCRFGDPETEVVLPRLESDIYDIFSAVTDGTLMPEIKWSSRVTLGFVLASNGYPGSYEKGHVITGLDEALALGDIRIYHMGTAVKDGGYVTAGGRVLMVVGSGDDLKSAQAHALKAVGCIRCDNLFYRRDIGWRVL